MILRRRSLPAFALCFAVAAGMPRADETPAPAAPSSDALNSDALNSDALNSAAPSSDALPESVRGFLSEFCRPCHGERRPRGKLDLSRFTTLSSIAAEPRVWEHMLRRVRDAEMPPEDEPMPSAEARDAFVAWLEDFLFRSACEDGIDPGPALTRRLNRAEYAATIRDLLEVHFNAGETLPADGAGGEGFDNAAETLFLSPVHLEKYLDSARAAIEYALRDPRARPRLLVKSPDGETSPDAAARRVLEEFLPRAFRRPVLDSERDSYLELFREAMESGEAFENAIAHALTGALISPHFLFHVEIPASGPGPEPLGDHELASRLSYFLWGSMPDAKLLDLAAKGALQEPATLEKEVSRLLRDGRVAGFATSFIEQWLGTRELGRAIRPERELVRGYDDDLEAVIRYEPVLFFQEILAKDLSVLTLIDADFTFLNNELARHYRLRIDGLREHPKRVDLPDGSHRGGVLGMAAVLAISSHAHRTSPVLRGKWVLETLLGTPPPAPPANVPPLPEPDASEEPRTVRERFAKHRESPQCAPCHDRIDPIGFGLENYDFVGRWREEEAGRPVDSLGRLPDGREFEGAEGLKRVLLERKEEIVRHLTAKLLGYALSRSLTLEDRCAVEEIVRNAAPGGFSARTLITEIVRSVPFRYKGPFRYKAGGG